jgi:hypothetical protein
MLLLLPFITCGLWLGQFINATFLDTPGSPHMRHNATLHRRNNINKYGGCDKLYEDPDSGSTDPPKLKGRDIVNKAYQDALRLADSVSPFLLDLIPDVGPIEVPPGVIENRYFGNIGGSANLNKKIYIRSKEAVPTPAKQSSGP